MDFLYGGMAGVMAVLFTNPLDVVKTRMQLQGELKKRNKYDIHYKNTLHAFYQIAKNDGIFALHKGIVPAVYYQMCLNGLRLGAYGTASNWGWTKNDKNEVSIFRTIIVSAFAGCLGSFIGSPFYLMKTHFQSASSREIAVGYQHNHSGTFSGLAEVYRKDGVRGLWRGSVSSLLRVGVGSAAQLASFSKTKELLEKHKIFKSEQSLWNTFAASMLAGVVIALFMAPFDVVQTRLYNQGVDQHGRGLLYTGITDCFIKMFKTEGLLGFFKGVFPCYLRIGPHSLLSLMFWDTFKQIGKNFKSDSAS
ncbi:UNVERIFIED_CONTAM: hypothetical protein PYX00_010356 [Menopon gallinae]|uniref:Solute carrier family 25 member 35 n=1 Tax=Menopon gallinae TaxID=328185 RepID=A0AAW2HEV5_9NEOP